MKQKFSTKWKKSKQPRKKVKYVANAPKHLKKRFLSGHLSKELRKKYGRRSFPLKKGDNVKIMRGKYKGKMGKVNEVNYNKLKVAVDNVQIQKKDGTKINVYLNASNLQIHELNLDDKKREIRLKKGEKIEEEKPKKQKTSKKPQEKKVKKATKTKNKKPGEKNASKKK